MDKKIIADRCRRAGFVHNPGHILNGKIPGVKVIVLYVNVSTTPGRKTGRIRKFVVFNVDVFGWTKGDI
jgi:hypothetical protein